MKRYGFGIDVGGTAIKMGLFTTDGELIEKWEIKTNKEDQGSRIFDDIAEQIDEKLSERNISKSEVAGIGIGVPGPVKADGTVVKCVNVGWGILNVELELATRTGLTVKAGNDANIAALGEMWKGGGRGCRNLIRIIIRVFRWGLVRIITRILRWILVRVITWILCRVFRLLIVIGGGVSKAGKILIDVIEKHFMEQTFHACRNAEFALAELGNDAGIYGGACLILQNA